MRKTVISLLALLVAAAASIVSYDCDARECAVDTDGYTFSVRANLLRWATMTPDAGLEWRVSPSVGVLVNGSWSSWESWTWRDGNWRYALWEVAPEVRYYMGEKKAWYLGAMFKAGQFNPARAGRATFWAAASPAATSCG